MGDHQEKLEQAQLEKESAIEQPQALPTKKKERFLLFTILGVVIAIVIVAIAFLPHQYNCPETDDKPIIYIYPEQEMEVYVELGAPERLTCVYPSYDDGWTVMSKPNGDLIDIKTGRGLYALYYESKHAYIDKTISSGFVVAKKDTVQFLEDKLTYLGLNEHEAEEFIIYWLPRLQANDYNLIRFATQEEININMPLAVTPTPDTTIRVLMLFEGLDEPVDVVEQELVRVERSGYVVVEWGGAEVDCLRQKHIIQLTDR